MQAYRHGKFLSTLLKVGMKKEKELDNYLQANL